jgi:hypothetical protein
LRNLALIDSTGRKPAYRPKLSKVVSKKNKVDPVLN